MKTIACTPLDTERLILRPPGRGDIEAIVRHAGDPRVALKTTEIPHPYHLGHALAWLDEIESDHESGAVETFAIERKSEPGMIGAISLARRPDGCSADVGYWLGVRYWRRGYVTEALRKVLHHGFEERGLLYIGAWYMAGNPASGRVMEKAGMKFENIVRQGLNRNGELHDRVNHGLFADEWRLAGG